MPSLIKTTYLFVTISLLLLASLNVNAQANDVDSLIKQAHAKKLAYHPYWMALLHYQETKKGTIYKIKSEIISPDFFLSNQGSIDPAAELEATLKAFFASTDDQSDNHARCRFVARYNWLKESLDWQKTNLPEISCLRFNNWSKGGNIKSISLVFATGYLSNPASFYGHILLKFNSDQTIIPNNLLDQSTNYGAIVPDNENPFIYITKGIFGGYNATFSNAQFYRHNHNYGENELRDMWEYELDLTDNQIKQIISHSWELLGNEFVYYFGTDNCAYQMAKLLEPVINQPLLSSNVSWAIPTTIFDSLASAEMNDKPVVKKISLIPSRQNRFYKKHSKLSTAQKSSIKTLINQNLDFNTFAYQELTEIEKATVIDTLFDYYEFRFHKDKNNQPYKNSKHQLLLERMALPAERQSTDQIISSNSLPPHHGSLPTLTRSGLIHNNKRGNGIEIQFRPAYYDHLSINTGRLKNSHLTMLDFTAVYLDEHLWLRKLDIVNIETLDTSHTGLPGDRSLAWKIKFGIEDQNLACKNCSVFNFTAGAGKATAITDNTLIYAMFEGVAETRKSDWGGLGGTIRGGFISSITSNWKSYLSIGYEDFLNTSLPERHITKWENRFGSSREWDIRITYEKEIASEFKTSASLYW